MKTNFKPAPTTPRLRPYEGMTDEAIGLMAKATAERDLSPGRYRKVERIVTGAGGWEAIAPLVHADVARDNFVRWQPLLENVADGLRPIPPYKVPQAI